MDFQRSDNPSASMLEQRKQRFQDALRDSIDAPDPLSSVLGMGSNDAMELACSLKDAIDRTGILQRGHMEECMRLLPMIGQVVQLQRSSANLANVKMRLEEQRQ